MAKNISLMGADYPDVPAVQLPQTGGGTATFYDINVVDNLNSTSATDALSANQGRELNNKIPSVVNNLTSDSTTSALSAAQGKALNGNKAAFASISETSYAHTEVTGYADAVSKLPSEFFGVAKITFKSNYVASALVSKTSNNNCTMLVTFDAGISPRHFMHVNGQNTLAVLAYNS